MWSLTSLSKTIKRQLYNDWLLGGNHTLTPGGKLKKPSVTMLGERILTAWGRISSESIL
jgi:hypothetical protein